MSASTINTPAVTARGEGPPSAASTKSENSLCSSLSRRVPVLIKPEVELIAKWEASALSTNLYATVPLRPKSGSEAATEMTPVPREIFSGTDWPYILESNSGGLSFWSKIPTTTSTVADLTKLSGP